MDRDNSIKKICLKIIINLLINKIIILVKIIVNINLILIMIILIFLKINHINRLNLNRDQISGKEEIEMNNNKEDLMALKDNNSISINLVKIEDIITEMKGEIEMRIDRDNQYSQQDRIFCR